MGLSSPAVALMASLSATGLTPTPNAFDGLGISTGLQATPGKESVVASRNLQDERIRQFNQIVELLNSRAGGYGITRDGICRLARIKGFDVLEDENICGIAGNYVDLEIVFDRVQDDLVTDAILKIATVGEGKHDEAASRVLRENLTTSECDPNGSPWPSLKRFEANLQTLSQLDHVDTSANCFEVIGGLYDGLRRIWEEEKTRLSWKSELQHVRGGAVGRPTMHESPNLGLNLEYWQDEPGLVDPTGDVEKGGREKEQGRGRPGQTSAWKMQIGCQAGYPSIPASQQWLASEVLVSGHPSLDSDIQMDETLRPAWTQPEDSAAAPGEIKDDPDAMQIDKQDPSLARSPGLRFACTLDPVVLLPIGLAAGLNVPHQMLEIDQTKAIGFVHGLQRAGRPSHAIPAEALPLPRWHRELITFDKTGRRQDRRHTYTVYSAAPVWWYPVESLSFNHPAQLAATLPVLRQYARLWTLLRSVTGADTVEAGRSVSGPDATAVEKKPPTKRPQKRSNVNLQQKKLDTLLRPGEGIDQADGDRRSVDVSLDLGPAATPSKARIELIIPLPRGPSPASRPRFANIILAVGLGGDVFLDVGSTRGVKLPGHERLQAKLTKVLDWSADLGVLAEVLVQTLVPES